MTRMPTHPELFADRPGLLRLGSESVNFYLVEQQGRYTLFDAGFPAHYEQLVAVLADRGADLSAIDAVVLTHAHPDHIGIAERVRLQADAPVYVHADDAPYATTSEQAPTKRPPTDYLEQPFARATFEAAMAAGVASIPPVREVQTFVDGDVLDVPGHPQVIATPGHSPGQSSLLLAGHGVLIVGDTLEGFNVLTGRYGPQIGPDGTNFSTDQALQSLERIEEIDGHLLFGHGDPWTWGAHAAVASARALGRS
jgi:glyoxylase-like metal-dependent hydrolase (beta-lactamase superfamily II)